MRVILLTCIVLFFVFPIHSQNNFQYGYSANNDESIEWIIPSDDGNLILAGYTKSLDPSGDGLIMKTDPDGNVIWSKIIGGQAVDQIDRIIACNDGGYLAVGCSSSFGQGDLDAWILRIDEYGEVVWSSCLGSKYFWDSARAAAQNSDGSFMVVGQTDDFTNGFMLALDAMGNLQWLKEITRDSVYWFNDVVPKVSGGYFFSGCMNHYGFGIHDTFIMETDDQGNLLRGKVYGSVHNDSFRILIPWEDGFLAVGDSWSWYGHQLGWISRIDKNLDIAASVVLGDYNDNQYLMSICVWNNSIFASLQLSFKSAFIVELNPILQKLNSWQFNPGSFGHSTGICEVNGNIYFSGNCMINTNSDKDIYLARFDPDEPVECNDIPHNTFIANVALQTGPLSYFENYSGAVYRKINLSNTNLMLAQSNLCNTTPPLLVEFTLTEESCTDEPVEIINHSQNALFYQWYFPGAEPPSSTLASPGPVSYENPGLYEIKLVAYNYLHADSLSKYIYIHPEVTFSLGPDTTITSEVTLQFILIGGYDEYLWSTGDTTPNLTISGYKLNYGNNEIWLQVTDGPCVSSDTLNIYKIPRQDFAELVIYPNPAWEGSLIMIKSQETPEIVTFFNMLGQEILVAYPKEKEFYLIGIEPGVYTVELYFNPNRVLRRFIVL